MQADRKALFETRARNYFNQIWQGGNFELFKVYVLVLFGANLQFIYLWLLKTWASKHKKKKYALPQKKKITMIGGLLTKRPFSKFIPYFFLIKKSAVAVLN